MTTITQTSDMIDTTVNFGSGNWFELSVGRDTTAETYMKLICKILNIKLSDIRYLMISGVLVTIDSREKTLFEYDMVGRGVLNAYVIFAPCGPRASEDIHDQITVTKMLQRGPTATEVQRSEPPPSFSQMFLPNLLLAGFTDVAVVIREVDFDRYITPVDSSDIALHSECLCADQNSQDSLCSLSCGHVFHVGCIRTQLTTVNPRCPVCQHDVRDDDIE